MIEDYLINRNWVNRSIVWSQQRCRLDDSEVRGAPALEDLVRRQPALA